MRKDQPTYPGLGQIEHGDYLQDIPYEDYIGGEQALPEGERVFDIRQYGAVPDGESLNTEAFAAACEDLRRAGGGVLLVQGGTYVTGTVRLPSRCTLFVADDAVLMASRDADQLISRQDGTQDFGDESSGGALISAVDAEKIRITGGGVIHGQGEWFVHPARKKPSFEPFEPVLLPRRDQAAEINIVPGSLRTAYRDRIRYAEDKYGEGKPVLRRPSALVWFLRCRDIRVDHIILRDSMCWTLHLETCDDILIEHMVIDDNRHVANADGIDLSGCRFAEIKHCFISCADDGLCVKNPAASGRSSGHLHFSGCKVCTVMNAFKIGTGTRYDISDVTVEDCDFFMTDIYPGSTSGISIESCDGSHLSGITARRIRMHGIQCPLYILLNRRNQSGAPFTSDENSVYWGGSITDVLVEDITADRADLPAILTGYLDGRVRKPLRNITVRNYIVRYRECPEVLQLPEVYDEFLTEYPECNAHGDVNACGLWIQHADHVTLENVAVIPRKADSRPVIVQMDVR